MQTYTHPIYGVVQTTGKLGSVGDFIEVRIMNSARYLPGGISEIYVSRKFLA